MKKQATTFAKCQNSHDETPTPRHALVFIELESKKEKVATLSIYQHGRSAPG